MSASAADWLFVVGIACEISGGVLVAGELVLVRASEIARRQITYPTLGEPLPIAQEGAAMAFVGVSLLGVGFVLQLLGYVVSSGAWWLIVVAIAVATFTYAFGRRVARRFVVPWRHGRAEREFADEQARKYGGLP